jgi:hypothetical protein
VFSCLWKFESLYKKWKKKSHNYILRVTWNEILLIYLWVRLFSPQDCISNSFEVVVGEEAYAIPYIFVIFQKLLLLKGLWTCWMKVIWRWLIRTVAKISAYQSSQIPIPVYTQRLRKVTVVYRLICHVQQFQEHKGDKWNWKQRGKHEIIVTYGFSSLPIRLYAILSTVLRTWTADVGTGDSPVPWSDDDDDDDDDA